VKKLLIAMALGAFLAWAFDPEQGSRRREVVKGRLQATGLLSPQQPTMSPRAA
jgi:hypothetical protein